MRFNPKTCPCLTVLQTGAKSGFFLCIISLMILMNAAGGYAGGDVFHPENRSRVQKFNIERDLSPTEKGMLRAVEDYFNTLTTFKARFLQVSSEGGRARGDFYLARPARLRIDYDPPTPIEIVADNDWFYYHDKGLQEVSRVSARRSPAAPFLQKTFSFRDGAFFVTDFNHDKDSLFISMSESHDQNAPKLTLIFSKSPLMLKKWTILDAQGVFTTVTLSKIQPGIALDRNIFVFKNPYPTLFE